MTAATENDVPNTLKTEAETPVKTEAGTESKNVGEAKKEELLEPIITDNVVVESRMF